MFSFFHRTPKLHVDCFTSDVNVYENTPIVRASKTIPDWWKELDTYKPDFTEEEDRPDLPPPIPFHLREMSKTTAKDCYAIIEFYKKGLVIESWTDMKLVSNPNHLHYIKSYGTEPERHERRQIGRGFPNHHHLKLVSPWLFKEKTGVQFVWVGASWALHNTDINVLPGVINFNVNNSTNINFVVPKRDAEYSINLGTPLCHIIPLSEKKLTFKNHLVSREEYNNIFTHSPNISFFGWKKVVEIRKRNQEREGKCPFGFGD